MAPEIRHWPEQTPERRAYDAVRSVPVQEENDTNRLGYHLFLHLKGELPDLDEVLHVAQARLLCSKDEAKRLIAAALADTPIGRGDPDATAEAASTAEAGMSEAGGAESESK
ncbi:MAG: hypothetical protein KFF77_00710 [Bacteroidetes bacterium]|nr:hypothetical protein [Bacteroidota bacterium]